MYTYTYFSWHWSSSCYCCHIFDGGIRFIYVQTEVVDIVVPNGCYLCCPFDRNNSGIATATMIGGINVCNLNANPKLQSVQSVPITNPGAGYTVAPGVRFTGGGGWNRCCCNIRNCRWCCWNRYYYKLVVLDIQQHHQSRSLMKCLNLVSQLHLQQLAVVNAAGTVNA